MFIFTLPALIKIVLTLFVILLLARRLPFYLSLFAGCFVIGVWMKMDVFSIVTRVWIEGASPQTLWLAAVIVLILILSGLLRRSGQLDRIVSSFERITPGRRFTVAAMPALIGLLPMPGGALFSAPMVDAALGKDEIAPEVRTAINYWFRHLWEYWWPLYPGVILGISLFGVESWKMIASQAPLTLGAIIGGMIFILPYVPLTAGRDEPVSTKSVRLLLVETAPIVVVILVFLGIQSGLAAVELIAGLEIPWPKLLSLVIGLATAIVVVIRQNSMDLRSISDTVLNPEVFSMVMIVFAIMSFKGVLIDSTAIEQVRAELAANHIPPLLIIAALPFIAGLVTGIAFGFAGAAFPVVAALLPEGHSPFPYTVLAFGFGYMGMMLSPVHLCLIVTREYFSADLFMSYRHLWKPALFGLTWTVLLAGLYRLVLG